MGNMTYDRLLNAFMDEISIEDISERHIREHYHRLATFRGVPLEDFKRQLRE
jgi:hypothetical protein